MKKRLFNLGIILLVLFANACKKEESALAILQPQVFKYVAKNTIEVSGQAIETGPLKDYEQGSDVVYQFTVSSESALKKFIVTTTSDVFSQESKVIKTEPENVIDASGNFVPGIKNVVVYYAYRIDPSIIPLTSVTATFAFQNESSYVGQTTDVFKVIKQGSTNGKLLNVIDLPWLRRDEYGIGNQETFNIISGIRGDNNVRVQNKRGAFFSLDLNADIGLLPDAIYNADKFDVVGYFPRIAGTNPVLLSNNYYLVSPSDTVVLTNSFVGARQGGLSLLGSSGTGEITVCGITKPITYATNTTVTATNFVTANKQAYADKGITLTSTTSNLVWVTSVLGAKSDPPVFTNLTGTLAANPYFVAPESILTFRKVIDMKVAIRQMALKLKAEGKNLKKTYFKRLDNITGPNKVTVADFDLLTHDNEFDRMLVGIKEEGKTVAGPMSWDEIYGFVTDDGKRGLIRTLPKQFMLNGVLQTPLAPNNASSDLQLSCTFKYQQQ